MSKRQHSKQDITVGSVMCTAQLEAQGVEPPGMNVNALDDRCRHAAQIFVTRTTRQKYPNGLDALCAAPIAPPPPSTPETAIPHILLVGPFQNTPDLIAVAIYVGIGFIEVRNLDGLRHTYELSAIDGHDLPVRDAYLRAALRLYFRDVKFQNNDA